MIDHFMGVDDLIFTSRRVGRKKDFILNLTTVVGCQNVLSAGCELESQLNPK